MSFYGSYQAKFGIKLKNRPKTLSLIYCCPSHLLSRSRSDLGAAHVWFLL